MSGPENDWPSQDSVTWPSRWLRISLVIETTMDVSTLLMGAHERATDPMPRKNRTPTSVIQNRDNQRRSRARRRQLVEELQLRLQDYERRGPQASIEMRREAKGVLWENKHLRDLLQIRGVSQDEIDDHLSLVGPIGTELNLDLWELLQRGSNPRTPRIQKYSAMQPRSSDTLHNITTYPYNIEDNPSPPSTSLSNHCPSVPSRALATSVPTRPTPSADIAEADCVVTNSCDHEKHDSYDSYTAQLPDRTSISFICNSNLPDPASHTDILPPVTDCFCPPSSPISISGHWNRGISCKAAINIISGLQNNADSDRVRDLLHCKESDDCLVQNSNVFQILDELA
ncbi:hypothetical protein HZ326_28276 [Fusarium oxysporum f. sp. albedinis]|nr:hypothetical protein HZ326_28276 [Fusarium oxysporum f. sp. albedinis]